MEEEITPINKRKVFNKEFTTKKNNSYLINFSLGKDIEIEANQIDNLIKKSFSNNYTFKQFKKNHYFQQFDTLNEIFDDLNEKMNNNKISIEENENNLIMNIPLPSYEEIIIGLKQKNLNDNQKINELTQLINEQNKEITNLKNEITQLKDDIIQIKNEANGLKQKMNILWEKDEKKRILNLDSKIIKENEVFNKRLKKWIDPIKKIKAELLYRLSENGDKFSTFHELCDNKGPTLTLFHVNDGNNVGIYTPISWDSTSDWKKDMKTFIFNLNKNQKYNKLKSDYFFYCRSLLAHLHQILDV